MITNNSEPAWRCLVCGYLHYDREAPESCPVCGAGQDEFESCKVEPPKVSRPSGQNRQWQCLVCNYLHEGGEAPATCPVCGADREQFEAVRQLRDETTMASPIRAVIVGGGVAGVAAAETIVKHSPESKITIISSENSLPYYRLNLTRYLAGEIVSDTLPIHPGQWYRDHRIELILGGSVELIEPTEQTLQLTDGTRIEFDKLILATGSHPYLPPLSGVGKPGVATLRTKEDAELILEAVARGRRCVCIGGGVLGIETAGALARQGADVSLLESHGWLMPRQLNPPGAAMLEQHMTAIGVKIIKQARSAEIEGQAEASGVRLHDGRIIPAELLIVATGVRPNTALARKTGLEVNEGIVVDNQLRTSSPNIFAAGDAAEHNGRLYGAWAPAQFQGNIAGLNAIGLETSFGGLPRHNTIKALGLEITSIGKFMPEDGSYIVIEQKTEKTYSEFVFHDGCMVGAILLGQAALGAVVQRAIEEKTDFSRVLKEGAEVEEIRQILSSSN